MTVSEIIARLGGTAEMMRLFGVGASAVSNWRSANRFPDRLHLRVLRLCEERGVPLTADELLSTSNSRVRRDVSPSSDSTMSEKR